MRITKWALLVAMATGVACLVADEKPKVPTFGRADLGKVPAGWKATQTGKGDGSIWKVVEDKTAPSKSGFALAQTAESPGAVFNLCVAEDTSFKDMEIAVAF